MLKKKCESWPKGTCNKKGWCVISLLLWSLLQHVCKFAPLLEENLLLGIYFRSRNWVLCNRERAVKGGLGFYILFWNGKCSIFTEFRVSYKQMMFSACCVSVVSQVHNCWVIWFALVCEVMICHGPSRFPVLALQFSDNLMLVLDAGRRICQKTAGAGGFL